MLNQTTRPDYVNSIELKVPQALENNDFDMLCYDGYAVGSNGIINVTMKYPMLWEISDKKIDMAMQYRFGDDWRKEGLKVSYSDIMMSFGEVTQIQQVSTI